MQAQRAVEIETPSEHVVVTPSVLYVGTPVALIVTCDASGHANITPMSSCWALGDRVVLGLSGESQGLANALRDDELTINFPESSLWPKVEAIARATGRACVPAGKAAAGYVHCGDKFALGGFTPQRSDLVATPRIQECALQFEARVCARHAPREGGPDFYILEAQVLRVHSRRDLALQGGRYIDTARWSPLLYIFRHYFGTGPDLGRTFKAEA